jgi:hypothetical protein
MNKTLVYSGVVLLLGFGLVMLLSPSLRENLPHLYTNNSTSTDTISIKKSLNATSTTVTTGVVSAQKQNTNTVTTKTVTPTNVVSLCSLRIVVSGGVFTPTRCQFRIVHSGEGPACDPHGIDPCLPNTDYRIVLEDSNTGHIHSVVLSQIRKLNGTLNFSSETKDFVGDIIDQSNAGRSLQTGSLTLGWHETSVTITIDASFSNSIHIEASGTIPVISEFAS